MPACSKCHKDVDASALFCSSCGTPVVQGTSAAEDPFVGRIFRDTYFVQSKIGDGGMGHVYKAVHVALDRPVALKVLKKALLADPSIVQRFHREARAASSLSHPNVVSVSDFGQAEDGTLFMAMELIAGRSLARVIAEDFPLPEPRVVKIATQILSALAEAHAAQILHRDLKPENVMIGARREERDVAKVLDFGIAKIQQPGEGNATLTQAGLVCGTPGYMSPEQWSGLDLDARSDIYSAGVILYEMLTGRLPFEASTPLEMVRKHLTEEPQPPSARRADGAVSPDLEAVVMRALAVRREDRFASSDEMREALLACAVLPGDSMEESATGPRRTVVMPAPTPAGVAGRRPTPRAQDRDTPATVIRPASTPAASGAAQKPRTRAPDATTGKGAPALRGTPAPRGTPTPHRAPGSHGAPGARTPTPAAGARHPTPAAIVQAPASPADVEVGEGGEVLEEAGPPVVVHRRRRQRPTAVGIAIFAAISIPVVAVLGFGVHKLARGEKQVAAPARVEPKIDESARATARPAPSSASPAPSVAVPPPAAPMPPATPAAEPPDAQASATSSAPVPLEAPAPTAPAIAKKPPSADRAVRSTAPSAAPERKKGVDLLSIRWKVGVKAFSRPPEAGTAIISVQGYPYGQVFLNGAQFGVEEPVEFLVPPGTYKVRVWHPGFNKEEPVRVDAGSVATCVAKAESDGYCVTARPGSPAPAGRRP